MTTVNIPNYEVKQKIGEGGMATVYLALHKLLDREVALKIMSPQMATSESFQKSFISEARIVAKLEHPHIVKIYDVGVENGQFYMAMEYLRNGTLKQKLANGCPDLEEAVAIIRQVAAALGYAHQKGYVHRDIKPANILFRENGEVALTDFGIAKLQGTVSDMTQMGYTSGTPHYMSPEQALGQTIDQRADLYSLGIVFYELLTGRKPYTADNAVAIAYAHVNTPIPQLEGEAAMFQPVLEKVLAKQPTDRYTTAQEFSDELQALTHPEDETLIVMPDTTMAGMQPDKTSKAGKWILLVAIIAGIGVAVGLYFLDTKRKELETKKVQAEINSHLEMASLREEKHRIFDYRQWSEGCKLYLEDIEGPYDGGDSAEWHYRQVLALAPDNTTAKDELNQLESRKKIEFADCDHYKREGADEDVLKDLFN